MAENIESLVKDLIAIKSVSGNEEKLADYLHQHLESQEIKTLDQDGNVVVQLKNGSDKALHFNAHMDTVDADPEKWSHNPWKPKAEDGKIYGLGASDVKGSIAALLKTIESLKCKELDLDLYFTFVKKEEIDGSGTESFMGYYTKNKLHKEYSKQACIITEPTGLETIEIGCKGSIFLEITTHGKSAHGSRTGKGNNATLLMFEVVEELKDLKEELKNYENAILGKPTISIGTTIKGGTSINKVPGNCKMTCDIRTIPEIHEDILQMVENAIGHLAEIEVKGKALPPVLTSEEKEICKIAKNVAGVGVSTASGSDDSVFYSQNGIDTIVLGPGEKEVIHSPDEYVETKKIENAIDIYLQLAEHF